MTKEVYDINRFELERRESLPVAGARDRILDGLERSGCVILSAPTGSGKSTQVPQFLLHARPPRPGRIVVLQPRRIAARSLAARVARETGTSLGQAVGYQVRFDNRTSRDTAVVFQTYGVFVQQMLADPLVRGVGTVVLDEFHERTLETDLCLAWLKFIRQEFRFDLRLVVMSATIGVGELADYLPGSESVEISARAFPVGVRHYPPGPAERIGETCLRALRQIRDGGSRGSTLIFMPGLREIRWTVASLGPYCRENGIGLYELHGSMGLEEQQKVLDPPDSGSRVIVATNVAETSLTIPGVTAVIDGGLHRISSYSPDRDINALYLVRISRRNAEQRAGRAGRTAPGICVRLWSEQEDRALAESVKPEILRLELSGLRLQTASLLGTAAVRRDGDRRLDWLNAPEAAAWERAEKLLHVLGALSAEGGITEKGRRVAGYPLPPRLASVLHAAGSGGADAFEDACAMAAVLESSFERKKGTALDLEQAAIQVRENDDSELPWEAFEIFRQLKSFAPSGRNRGGTIGGSAEASSGTAGSAAVGSGAASSDEVGSGVHSLHTAWLFSYVDRLASRLDGQVYQFGDGRKALLSLGKKAEMPRLVLALEIHETAGAGQVRQVAIPVYMTVEPALVRKMFPDECIPKQVSEWDEKRKKVISEERIIFRGVVLEIRQMAAGAGPDRNETAALWADRLASGEIRLEPDEKVDQLVVRLRLGRRYYPDYGFPGMNTDDWRLVYGEVCQGKNSLAEIAKVPLYEQICRYAGQDLCAFLEKALPVRWKMPNGKTGKITYFEDKPAELSARLGDFIGFSADFRLCEGRCPVLFDILAPNYRTVQKTADLGSFWKNAYPAIKKELQRKYPRHPWP